MSLRALLHQNFHLNSAHSRLLPVGGQFYTSLYLSYSEKSKILSKANLVLTWKSLSYFIIRRNYLIFMGTIIEDLV